MLMRAGYVVGRGRWAELGDDMGSGDGGVPESAPNINKNFKNDAAPGRF